MRGLIGYTHTLTPIEEGIISRALRVYLGGEKFYPQDEDTKIPIVLELSPQGENTFTLVVRNPKILGSRLPFHSSITRDRLEMASILSSLTMVGGKSPALSHLKTALGSGRPLKVTIDFNTKDLQRFLAVLADYFPPGGSALAITTARESESRVTSLLSRIGGYITRVADTLADVIPDANTAALGTLMVGLTVAGVAAANKMRVSSILSSLRGVTPEDRLEIRVFFFPHKTEPATGPVKYRLEVAGETLHTGEVESPEALEALLGVSGIKGPVSIPNLIRKIQGGERLRPLVRNAKVGEAIKIIEVLAAA